jgi:NADPH:quinone reductase-like Zn-dependent oxidoreductase
MKCVIYQRKNQGDHLILSEVAKPEPGKGEVLIRLVFTAINAADYRSMSMGIIPGNKVFGADVAGVVESVGDGVRDLKVGDAVFGDLASAGFGGFAEYVVAPENLLAKKPDSVTFEQAAAVPMAALTALQALRDQGKIQAGKKVLVYGAGGGVGTFAVQLADYFDAEVTAVCGTDNVELVQALGASRVIDYTKEDITKGSFHFDLILGINGNHPLATYRRMLTPQGIFVAVGGSLSQVFKTLAFGPILSLGGKKYRMLAAKPSVKDLEFIVNLVETGRIKPIIDRCYPLQQTAEAMRYSCKGHARGKVLISIGKA